MKPEPEFLEIQEVRLLHLEVTAKWGGDRGLRDEGALSSAVDAPRWRFQLEYDEVDIFDLAATYAYHIAESQAFLDGNKRTGTAVALTFLSTAGFVLPDGCDLKIHAMLLSIGTRNAGRDDLAGLLRELVNSML